jgi:hypothetical protein
MFEVIVGASSPITGRRPQPTADLASLQTIRRATNAQCTPVQDVRVNHRRADIGMAEQFLDRPNVVPVLEQMCRKGMAESVTADPLRDACAASSGSDRALHDRFVQMIPGRWPEARVSADSPCGENELPAPVGGRIGILPIEGRRKCDAAETVGQITLMLSPDVFEMCRQARLDAAGKHRPTILLPFATPDHDLMAVEIEIFDAQLERLLKPEPSPVEQRHDEPRDSCQLVYDGAHLVNAEDDRDAYRAVCVRHVIDRSGIKTKHVPIQEQERAERLVLCRRADLLNHREVREIPTDLVAAHLRRMSLAVENNKPSNPRGVGFFCPAAVVTKPNGLANTIEQLRLGARCGPAMSHTALG